MAITRLWIGDSIFEQVSYVQERQKELKELEEAEKAQQENTEEESKSEMPESLLLQTLDVFLTDPGATLHWQTTTVAGQLPLLNLFNASVIFLLGFNDCVHSCVWPSTFNITTIAKKYAESYKSFIDAYPDLCFYVCTIPPVDDDYSFSFATDGLISKDTLNNKIKSFNEKLLLECKNINSIDLYKYFDTYGFETRDGNIFTAKASDELYKYIVSQTLFTGFASNFTLRAEENPDNPNATGQAGAKVLVAPSKNDPNTFIYWLRPEAGGCNDCAEIEDGCVLPNCVGYAYGRFMEIMAMGSTELPTDVDLSTGDAGMWYPSTSDSYERGQDPRPGAVICWSKDGGAGHVGIVEKVLKDGSIITSESGFVSWDAKYNESSGFWAKRRVKGADGNWGQGGAYHFQGFIYNPAVTAGGGFVSLVSKAQVTMEDKYLTQSEMELNARYIWQYLGSRGWTLNAVAGMLGNMQSESTMSPNRYEESNHVSCSESLVSMKNHPTLTQEVINEVSRYFNAYKANNSYYKNGDGRFPGCGLTGWTFGNGASYSPSKEYYWYQNKYISRCLTDDVKNQIAANPSKALTITPASFARDFRDIDSGLEQLIWEAENNKQFGKTDAYPITFKEFTKSTKPARWLAEAFLDNYENPANPNFQLRGDRGEAWFNYLLPYAPGMAAPLSINNIKVKYKSSTEILVSAILRSWSKYEYKLFDSSNEELFTKTVENEALLEDTEKEDSTNNDEEATDKIDPVMLGSVIDFEHDDLVPNATYRVAIKAFGASEADETEDEYTFTIPQEYPKSVKSIELVPIDNKLPNELFELKIDLPTSDNSYWVKRSNRYFLITIIVNGKAFDSIQTSVLETTSTLNLAATFPRYHSKCGDSVQIKIDVCTTDSDGNVIKNKKGTTSNVICFLKQPFISYLERRD